MTKATLLVVEDEPNLLLGIRDILEIDEYRVLTAQNGMQALEVLREVQDDLPDLIVSDIMMPHMDGMEFLREVRGAEEWETIPFIFLTAKGEKSDKLQGKKMGVDDYLVKPFDADELLVAVENKLQRVHITKVRAAKDIALTKSKILTILNHEARTPLTLVVAYADMLGDNDVEGMDEAELLMFLQEIRGGADRLRRLIENLILAVELNTEDAHKTFDWRKGVVTDLHKLIEAAYNQIIGSESVQHTCDVIIEEPLPPIVTDREFFVIMLRELLDNAVKFSEADEPILLEAKTVGDYLHVAVTDTGRGIPEHKKNEIWEVLYQENRELYEDQGAGSGLAIVKGLIDMHDGADKAVESEEGKGSTFTLMFPIAD